LIKINSASPIQGACFIKSAPDMLTRTLKIQFGAPKREAAMSLEACIRRRRSLRAFAEDSLTKDEVGQLLWAAQGITGANGERTAPSAGALYPLALGVVVGSVASIPTGIYRYFSSQHQLAAVSTGDSRVRLAAAALNQQWIALAPAVFYIAGAIGQTTSKYGDRGLRYVFLEAGHAAQNLMLQAVSLGLGSTMVGAFPDTEVSHLLALDPWETPLCLLPVGKP
jgi:SagB-type dehydrogenase family enzyme